MSTPPTPTNVTPCDARMMAATAVAVSRESRRAAELEQQRALMLGGRRGERVTIRVSGIDYSGAAEILYVQPEEEPAMAALDGGADTRRPVSEAVFEKMADGRVMRRLQRDPRYRHAETAEAQQLAEEAIEAECVAELDQEYRIVDPPSNLAG